jgi:hypothetical protein
VPSWTPIVQCIRRSGEEPRFIVTDFDPTGPYIRGPRGEFTASEVRAELAKHGFSDGEIESLMQRATA